MSNMGRTDGLTPRQQPCIPKGFLLVLRVAGLSYHLYTSIFTVERHGNSGENIPPCQPHMNCTIQGHREYYSSMATSVGVSLGRLAATNRWLLNVKYGAGTPKERTKARKRFSEGDSRAACSQRRMRLLFVSDFARIQPASHVSREDKKMARQASLLRSCRSSGPRTTVAQGSSGAWLQPSRILLSWYRAGRRTTMLDMTPKIAVQHVHGSNVDYF